MNVSTLSTNNRSFVKETREWLWPLALAVTVFLVSGRSQVAAPSVPGIDKIAHFFVYGLLGTLIARVPTVGRLPLFGAYWAVAIASFYGITDEFHQSFTPGRSVEVADWLMDTTGAALAVAVYTLCGFYRKLLERSLTRSPIEISADPTPDFTP